MNKTTQFNESSAFKENTHSPSKVIGVERKFLQGTKNQHLTNYYDSLESVIWEIKKAKDYLNKN